VSCGTREQGLHGEWRKSIFGVLCGQVPDVFAFEDVVDDVARAHVVAEDAAGGGVAVTHLKKNCGRKCHVIRDTPEESLPESVT